MTVTQTVEVPASQDREQGTGNREQVAKKADPKSGDTAGEHAHTHPCPICAAHIDPVTGNPRYNAETVAAIEEGIAISNGEIPVKWCNSLEELLEELRS